MKSFTLFGVETDTASLPVRGAWIEIPINLDLADAGKVAPRKGSVD